MRFGYRRRSRKPCSPCSIITRHRLREGRRSIVTQASCGTSRPRESSSLIQVIERYGHVGDPVRGLMFCSRKMKLEPSTLLNQNDVHGKRLRTRALTGEDRKTVNVSSPSLKTESSTTSSPSMCLTKALISGQSTKWSCFGKLSRSSLPAARPRTAQSSWQEPSHRYRLHR